MAALNFPTTRPDSSPLQPGDQYTGDNNITYVWDGVKWVGHVPAGGTTDQLVKGPYSFRLGSDGLLTLPSGNTRIGDLSGGGSDNIIASTGTIFGIIAQGAMGTAGLQWIEDISSLGSTSTQTAGIAVNPFGGTTGTVQIVTGVTTGTGVSNTWTFGIDGTLTIPGDIQDSNGSVIHIATTSTAPTRVNGQLWFNDTDGRMYVFYNSQWIDTSPVVVPPPETYLGDIEIDGSTLTINGSTLTINTGGTLLVNGSEVTGGGSGYQLTSSTAMLSLASNGLITFPEIEDTKTLWGAVDEDFTILTTRTNPGQDADININAADDIWMEAYGDDIILTAANQVRITSDSTGSNYTWTFAEDGLLTLPEGGIISNGMGAIRLDPAGSGSTQALLIYPTTQDGDHIHLTAGGGGTTDLYLGNDTQYVKVDHSGTVVIGTYETFTTSTWVFGTDGVLTLPNDMTIDASVSFGIVTIGGTSTYISIDNGGAPPALTIATNQGENAWQFGYDGVLTLSTASTILGTGTDPNVYIETATTSTTSTWTFGTNGILTLPAATPVIRGGGTGTDVTVIATTGSNTATWTFAADGSLTFPDATVQNTAWTGTSVLVNGTYTVALATTGQLNLPGAANTEGNNARIQSANSIDILSNLSIWTFSNTGTLTFPDTSTQTTAWLGGGSSSLSTNDTASNNFNTGNFTNQYNLDIEYTAFTGDYGVNFDITYQKPLDSTKGVTVGAIETPLIMSTGTVILKTDISSSTSTWTFGIDGTLTFPNGANIAIPAGVPRTGAIAITSSTELLIGTNTTTTNNLWTFGIDGSTVFPENTVKGYCFTATNTVFNYIPTRAAFMYTDSPILGLISTIGGAWYIKGPGLVGWKQITAVQDNGGVALLVDIGPMGDGSEFHSGGYQPNSPDLVYTISQYLDLDLKAADKTWTFSENGSLTFPDTTVQTTAYVAANVVNRTTGSWTLATGANTVSITVPPNSNYTMWVNGNIPNGIVNWNATVNVSNTNVPAIGSQYAWYYAAGNALVLTSIPNQIVGTAGVISSSTGYTGTTSNVFSFGITNNSTSTRTVYWGYTTL
jgi:hypothetical protein